MRKKFWTLSAIILFSLVGVVALIKSGPDQPEKISKPVEQVQVVTGTVWVADEDGNSLTAIDATSQKVVTTLTGIPSPHNVQVSPDGKTLWVVSGSNSIVAALDAKTLALLRTAATGAMPAHVVISPDGKTVFVTNNSNNTVSVIDAITMKSLATIAVGSGPHGLRPSPDGKWLYVANLGGKTLSVINLETSTKVAEIEVGKAPAQVAFSPDGSFLYVSLNGENAVAKIDVATRKFIGKVKVGLGPIQTFVTPDNRYILVANQGTKQKPNNTVSIIDTKTFAVVKTISTGKGAHGIVVEPTSKQAYITNTFDNDVAIIDLTELRVIARIPVGSMPNGISFSTETISPRPSVKIEFPNGGMSDAEMENMP